MQDRPELSGYSLGRRESFLGRAMARRSRRRWKAQRRKRKGLRRDGGMEREKGGPEGERRKRSEVSQLSIYVVMSDQITFNQFQKQVSPGRFATSPFFQQGSRSGWVTSYNHFLLHDFSREWHTRRRMRVRRVDQFFERDSRKNGSNSLNQFFHRLSRAFHNPARAAPLGPLPTRCHSLI